MDYCESKCTSILVRSKLPDTDYVINPYTGCEFGCAYCYASFMGRFVHESIENWGNYLYVKTNAAEVLKKELSRLPLGSRHRTILLSSVTDPYQGAESTYRLTRRILEVLAEEKYPGLVTILTKSPLVLRDTDILRRLPRVEVGITVTTADDQISRWFERRAPLASRRITALKQLRGEGISTYAFVGPLFPHFRYQQDALDSLFASLAAADVGSVYVEYMNLRKYIKQRIRQSIEGADEEMQRVCQGYAAKEQREALGTLVNQLLVKYRLTLRLGEVLSHN